MTLIGGDYTGKGNSLLTCGLLIFIQILWYCCRLLFVSSPGTRRGRKVGKCRPFLPPQSTAVFQPVFCLLAEIEGYATKPILVVFRVWLPCGRTQKFIVQVVSGWIFNISKMAGGNNQKRAGSVVYPEEPIQPTDCWVGSDKFCSPLSARKSKI